MDDFKRMAIFAAVVQQGSMSAAARTLAMTPSAVSQQVRQLERDGGVTLMHRTTRQLTLTDAGQRFYAECARMVEAASNARAELQAELQEPSGELRISSTVGFARHIAPALGPLLANYPQLRLQLLVDDAQIDLTSSRIDLAIRYGNLPDSQWVARRLGTMHWWPCASPQWLAAHGEPESLQDLLTASWMGLPAAIEFQGLQVRVPSAKTSSGAFEEHVLPIEPRIASNNQLALLQMCEAGLGIALLGSMDVQDAISAGRLVPLCRGWDFGRAGGLPIWAVTPQRNMQPAKVRLALEHLSRYLSATPGVFHNR
ncbi:LysR family transcriptional regulator [Diaphorobacter sp. HDW4A]|uniref:LysR family transcriptional regulator n=1 Tax=Diaphorobacter sp. HDW4A TaxID=2714924 RepID=UPI00140791A1|nr:LysR family transcriptional regulator [Diaphorobacter sp. HDW4A]QIL81150.1 LysR family transcriptional regulator [Diaphorobacter sp. HDW4A]